MPRYAISDIHGCLKTFQALLDKIQFSKSDTLYLLGDYVDRGPDSKGVIDYIWQLEKEGYTIHCLQGNHEQLLLQTARPTPGSYTYYDPACLHSFGIDDARDLPAEYLDWLYALPYYFELEDYYLVHAGFNFAGENPLHDRDAMIWIRNWYQKIDRYWLDGKIIVHGHTPMPYQSIQLQCQQLEYLPALDIDAGCVFPYSELNHLCAFNLDSRELVFQKNTEET
jgi:serine/threonine protein phosphatase 1